MMFPPAPSPYPSPANVGGRGERVYRMTAAFLCFAIAACHHGEPEKIETAGPVPVEIVAPRVGTITSYVRATGLVQAAPGADWTAMAPEAARVAAVHGAPGDAVKRGTVLVQFDAPALRVELATRSGAQSQAEARVDNARRNHERLQGLFEKGIASRKDVEDSGREMLEAQAAVREATQARTAASALSAQASAVAPFDGIVAERWHNPGELVDAHEHVLRVVDTRRLEVTTAVAAGDASRLHAGQAAHVVLPGTEEAVDASVIGEPAVADSATGTVSVRLKLEGKAAIGTPVTVEIAADARDGAIILPASAVLKEEAGTAVFVVDGGHAHKRKVVLGLTSGEEVEIASGLAASENVVAKGTDELPDGAAVAAEKE
jgi:membrane fusion protein (multidrug efflux system)